MHSTGTGQPVETQDIFFWRLAGRSALTGLAIVHWIGYSYKNLIYLLNLQFFSIWILYKLWSISFLSMENVYDKNASKINEYFVNFYSVKQKITQVQCEQKLFCKKYQIWQCYFFYVFRFEVNSIIGYFIMNI